MYREIKVLPPELSQKIAAGEVIERPAQAVKELVENSIDAESTDITVEFEKGGKTFIKVVDDGTGMRKKELGLAFSRYSTSKISSISDLENITTLGFRGEALASLASSSRIEAITRCEEEETAGVLRIEGGREKYMGETSRRRGTTIIMKDLFYNLPARKKFLKSDSTETGHILDILSRMAIVQTDIHLKVVTDGNTVFDLPKDLSFERRIGEVYGRDIEKEIIRLKGEKGGFKIGGGILPPTNVRNNRELQIFIVNKRPVRCPFLGHAVSSAFSSLIPSGKFPIVFILLDVPANEVDVNIHPAKREIKFVKEREVHAFIFAAIRLALQNARIEENTIAAIPPVSKPVFEKTASKPGVSYAPITEKGSGIVREEVEAYLDEIMGPMNIIGQVRDTYIIIEKNEGIELVDQHAAHERILYEKLKKSVSEGRIEKQALLFPVSFELGPSEALFLKENLVWLRDLGMEIEEFGKNTFNLRTIPANVKTGIAKEFILGFISEFRELSDKKGIADMKNEALKIMACRASIMAGNKLTGAERDILISDLNKCADNMTCPHGRPIKTVLSWSEIGKRFKRV